MSTITITEEITEEKMIKWFSKADLSNYIAAGKSTELNYTVVVDVNAVAGLYQLDLSFICNFNLFS